jgi:hypothetical protein
MPETDMVARCFAVDTAEHEMEILHDEGLYRHVRFAPPGGSSYWYDLITAPNVLIFRGAYESLVFSRVIDMFGFFRSNPDRLTHRISPDYWAEKLTSDDHGVQVYSQDRFEQLVKEATVEAIRSRAAPRGLGKAVREQILGDEDIHYEAGARQALEDFEYGAKTKIECYRCRQTLVIDAGGIAPLEWKQQHAGHAVQWGHKIDGFRFTDTYEWDFKDFDHGYLWACHAIVAGIAQYDAAKAVPAVRVGSVSPTGHAELGLWLRALPVKTILTDRDGTACQIDTGEEHIHRAPNREFPALFVAGDPFEITDGHEQIEALAKWSGPFTVVALGQVQVGEGNS